MTTIDLIDGALTVVWEERQPGQLYTGRVQFAPSDTTNVMARGALVPSLWSSADRRLPESVSATTDFVHIRPGMEFFPNGTAYCHGVWHPTWCDAAIAENFPLDLPELDPAETNNI
jgi:hypothetical protein